MGFALGAGPPPPILARLPAGGPDRPIARQHGRHTHPRCPAPTTCRGIDLDLPRDRLIVITGPVRVRQVVARVRHDLRRGPAPLRRVAVRLRAAVPVGRWRSPTSTTSRACRRRSRSSRRRRRTTRARRSARSPRSTTTCACSMRAPACRAVPITARSWRPSRSARWSIRCLRCPKARAFCCSHRSCRIARASTSEVLEQLRSQGLRARDGRRQAGRARRAADSSTRAGGTRSTPSSTD